jgi:uncharacterized protein YndB with AHSA1/START domain
MNDPVRMYELTLTRTIPASPEEVFDAWLDPSVPCNPWNGSERIDWEPKEGGLWYFMRKMDVEKPLERAHFGRFAKLQRGERIELDWMSYNTRGIESHVTVTLKAKGDETVFLLKHSNIPDDELGRAHEKGWAWLTGKLEEHLAKKRTPADARAS